MDASPRAHILVALRTRIVDLRCDHVEKIGDRAIAKKPRPVYLHAGVHVRGLGGDADVDRLRAMRSLGEGYSDVVRLRPLWLLGRNVRQIRGSKVASP